MDKMKRNFNRVFSVFLIVLILLTSFSYASYHNIPEASRDFYVYDETGIIGDALEKHIIDINKKLYSTTGAQVVVAVPNDLGNLDKNLYATKLFEEWEIGEKGKDNGVLILIVPSEGEMWIEIGYGLEGAIPDSIAKRILEDHMIEFFRQDDYEKGILSGFNQIVLRIEDEYNIDIDGISIEETPMIQESSGIGSIIIFIIIMLLIFLDSKFLGGRILRTIFRSMYIMNSGRRGGPPRGGGSGGSSGGGGRSGGGGAGGSW